MSFILWENQKLAECCCMGICPSESGHYVNMCQLFKSLLCNISIVHYLCALSSKILFFHRSVSCCQCLHVCVVVKTNGRSPCYSGSNDLTTQGWCMLGAVQYVGQAG